MSSLPTPDLPPSTSDKTTPPTDTNITSTTTSQCPPLPPPGQQPQEQAQPRIPLPHPFTNTTPQPRLIAHGAEALVYKTSFLTPSRPCILKHRPPKPWRHATLDARLTKHRILAEARILVRARREGVCVPAVLALDAERGWICLEFVGDGVSVKMGLEGWRRWRVRNGDEKRVDGMDGVGVLLRRIGMAVGRLHAKGFVHGDLTSSNLMLRSEHGSVDEGPGEETCLSGEVVLIDFGLASTSCQEEDRAVDLYVLERAMGSTHPWLEAEFGLMLDGYRTSYKGASATLKRLEEVRMRGRKRSMLG